MDDEIDIEHLFEIINPENKTMKDGTVESRIESNKLVTEIKGKMSVGTLLNTIDDILKTASLAKKITEKT